MKKLLVLTLFLCAAGIAWGASTAENRNDKTVYVGIAPIGIHIPTYFTHPVSVGVYLGDFLIGGEYGKFSVEMDDDGSKAKASFLNMGGYGRWFPGNSFNVSLALHKRVWDAEATVDANVSPGVSKRVGAHMKADATVITAGIGNQWITDFGMVIGMDWLVVSGRASTTSSGTINSNELATLAPGEKAEAEANLKELGDLLNRVSSLGGIFILSLGWSF